MTKKIVVSLQTDKQDYQRMQAEDARVAAARAGIEIEVVFADGKLSTQIEQISAFMVASGDWPVGFVVEAVTAEGLERMARNAAQLAMGWVLVSSEPPYIDCLRAEYPTVPIAAFAVDNREIGEMQAQQVHALLPRGGQILVIEGPGATAAAIGRRHGLQQRLEIHGIHVGKALAADWTEAGAERATTSWLPVQSVFKPDLIAAQNDSMAVGARRAIQAARPDWGLIPMIGCDGLPMQGRRLVDQGVLAATVVKPTTAGKGLDVLVRALRGERLPSSVEFEIRSYPALEVIPQRRRCKETSAA